jgi:hypothetical protein
MVLWKKTSSGQGDPPGPLGKYITMYNKAVKTLGTDNPEVLKNFFASQQYGQNNTQVQQNNNINKAPQPKESKIGNVAGDVGTLALSTLQNFGMNIPGDVIKTVAPKAAILDVLPQTTTNQYVKQRNQSLGQNIKDVGDAANTVAAFEIGAPLVAKGVQAGVNQMNKIVIGESVLNKVIDPVMKKIYKPIVKRNVGKVYDYVQSSQKPYWKDFKNIPKDEILKSIEIKPYNDNSRGYYRPKVEHLKNERLVKLGLGDEPAKIVINPYRSIDNPGRVIRHETTHFYDYYNSPFKNRNFGEYGNLSIQVPPKSNLFHGSIGKEYLEQPTEVMARIITNKSVGKNTIDQYSRLLKAGWSDSQLSKLWKKYSLIPPTVGVGLLLQNKNTKP